MCLASILPPSPLRLPPLTHPPAPFFLPPCPIPSPSPLPPLQVSAFQQHVRGDCSLLTEHISKQMNELNLERCRCIPKNCPGADWRVLEEIVKADPAREKFKVGAGGRALGLCVWLSAGE